MTAGADPELSIVGPMERFALVDLHPGASSFGVRLKPGWALPQSGAEDAAWAGVYPKGRGH
jgi:hypothetical protein